MEKKVKARESGRGRGWSRQALGLVLLGGALLALGVASTRNAVADPASSARVETASGVQTAYYAEAQRDTLDLQLD